MTIIIGVAVSEGLVLAGDSRTTLDNAKGWKRAVTDNAEKVFRLTDNVGAATCGWAYLGGKTMAAHVEDFSRKLNAADTIDQVVPLFAAHFQQLYDGAVQQNATIAVAPGRMAFGFILGGYSGTGEGQLHQVLLPGPNILVGSTTSTPGAAWNGQTDVACRLIKGWDPRLPKTTYPANVQTELDGIEYVIYFGNLTLQDAVDFAVFLARTTIDMQRFSDGVGSDPGDVPGCGGPIDVAVVTPNGFTWVKKKELH